MLINHIGSRFLTQSFIFASHGNLPAEKMHGIYRGNGNYLTKILFLGDITYITASD